MNKKNAIAPTRLFLFFLISFVFLGFAVDLHALSKPVVYLNSSFITSIVLTQGEHFTLLVTDLYPVHYVHYDQIMGPNGRVLNLGPLGISVHNGSFTKSFSTSAWSPGTYQLVVYSKNGWGRKTSGNSNVITISVVDAAQKKSLPSAYLNNPQTTNVTLTQGESFSLFVNRLLAGQDVYYDQLSGPNGTIYNQGPIDRATATGSLSKVFNTTFWSEGTYRLVVYSKDQLGLKSTDNSNVLTITVKSKVTKPTPVAYLNSPQTTHITLTQGQNFTLVVNHLSTGGDVYYDQLSGPNGAVTHMGPIDRASAAGSMSRVFSTSFWPKGTYQLVIYSKDVGGQKTTENSNTIAITVKTPDIQPSPKVFINAHGTTQISLTQGGSFSLLATDLYPDHDVYYDQIVGPNGTTVGQGPLARSSLGGSFTRSFLTTHWPVGTYQFVIYSKNGLGLKTSENSNTISITVQEREVSLNNPIGVFEKADCLELVGWTCDKDNVNQWLNVQFYADGPKGTGAFIGSTVARIFRSDVMSTNFCEGTSLHGFSLNTPAFLKDGQSHQIYAYGMNIETGKDSLLSVSKSLFCSVLPENRSLQYFGFAFVGDSAQYVAETMPFSNAAHLGAKIGQNHSVTIKEIASKQGRVIIGLHDILFKEDINLESPRGGQGWRLAPDYLSRWFSFQSTHADVLNSTHVLAFYMADEPTWNGISAQDLQIATDLVAKSYPDIPRLIVEAYSQVSKLVVPNSASWVGFNQYTIFDPALDNEYQQRYQVLKNKRTSAHQKMVIIGDVWWGANRHGLKGISQEDMAKVALNYYYFASRDPEVVALLGFLWPSFPEGVGARELPLGVINTWRQIGKFISGK